MKLRIQNDSLRLRLTRSEVAELRVRGRVEATLHFSSGAALVYSLETSRDSAVLSADLGEHRLRITCPLAMAIAWAGSDQTSMESGEASPRILVEKDFQCLHQFREGDVDACPNPLADAGP